MTNSSRHNHQSGQALILLLVLMIVSITILSAAVIINIVGSQGASNQVIGQYTLNIAESGAENALLRLLRDPNFAGETIFVDGGVSTSTVSGSANRVIDADGKLDGFTKKVEVTVSYNNNILNILSWKEVSP